MSNILLLEPNYPAKYPPLGLMKIFYYHKHIRNDKLVVFAKGKLNEEKYYAVSWDRVYVSTLFTYEWDKTVEAIKYALELVENDEKKIFIGGIAATLLPDDVEVATGIKPITGLLKTTTNLGYDDNICIDELPPAYEMLEQVQYKYEYSNHYFAYTTRGCGMNCSFCAVKILEPDYIPRVQIGEQISAVRKIDDLADPRPGELRHNLLLLDNNVLRSRNLQQIINEIKKLGFEKGATFKNKETGNIIRRFVDFNQGLDANLLTPKKAKLLGQIALRPARIAFDHIKEQDTYIRAIKYLVEEGITDFSNYILYNADDSEGKGKTYPADTPEDLYERLKITVKLREDLNKGRNENEKIYIYSFPMRYIPLDHKERGHVGPNWNKKYLRAIQVMLTPTRGKGVSGKSFFEAAFGESVEQFRKFILMPEEILAGRGRKKNDDGTPQRPIEIYNEFLLSEWERLWEQLPDKEFFKNFISENEFTPKRFLSLPGPEYKKLFLLYFSPSQMLGLFDKIKGTYDADLVNTYLALEAPQIYSNVVEYIASTQQPTFKVFIGFYGVLGREGVNRLISSWINKLKMDDQFLVNIGKLLIEVRDLYIDIDALRVLQAFSRLGVSSSLLEQSTDYVLNMDYSGLWVYLKGALGEVDQAMELKRDQPGFKELQSAVNYIKDLIYGRLFVGGIS